MTLDYANEATEDAFGVSLESLEGKNLDQVPGGLALRKLLEQMLKDGTAHQNERLMAESSLNHRHIADCAIVRSSVGVPTRLVVVLTKTAERAWWRFLWQKT